MGKGKQAPSNAVDTTFKARCECYYTFYDHLSYISKIAIALPSQSIAHATDANVPSTRRRLTFEDLLSHLKHYNAGTRRGSEISLLKLTRLNIHFRCLVWIKRITRDKSGTHSYFPDRSAEWLCTGHRGRSESPTYFRLNKSHVLQDASVRKALLNFLGWLFPRVPLVRLPSMTYGLNTKCMIGKYRRTSCRMPRLYYSSLHQHKHTFFPK